ncbi:hypothetical protein BV25DRAFT_334870 [Artomyces pyxidatus]|uniref:Uncharacterized protein n=1 Tax=Artomyces pyxidatus TaxID=48021 RepID=A0ACB8T5K4_9AGAM|nr:hypothetical protein BV25DRAFT_334870 [Artomyces pyxidatus]
MNSSFLFPLTFYSASLESWAADLHASCLEADQCFLEQIVHYKAVNDMEHEFLLVSVRHPAGSLLYLGVDRNAEEGNPEQVSDKSSSSRYILDTLMNSSSSTSTSSPSTAMPPVGTAFDGVQISHDGTPAPILARHGPVLPLNTLTFPRATPSTRPSLLHLSVLLLVIRADFPSYVLLKHQCYFFARSTLLCLAALFDGAEEPHPEHGALQGTWRGAHVSFYEAGKTAVQNMLLLPLVDFPVLLVPAGLFALYSAVRLYDGHTVSNTDDRRKIGDDKIMKQDLLQRYREAWSRFTLERERVQMMA